MLKPVVVKLYRIDQSPLYYSLQVKMSHLAPSRTASPELSARGKRQRRLPQHFQDFEWDQRFQSSLQVKISSPAPARTVSIEQEPKEEPKEDYKNLDACSALPPEKPKSFTTSSLLKTQQSVYTREKPFCCSHCGKRFAQGQLLKQHQKMHCKHRPYCCRQCRKSFTTKSLLETHQRIHTSETPYCCDQCKKRFPTKYHLKTHQYVLRHA